jgi:hypothetical protein
MKALICHLSTMRVDRNVVRITGLMMAAMIALYAVTGQIIFIIVIAVDYCIRAFTPMQHSPFSWMACQIARLLNLDQKPIDKAPKIFAARVGFLFALAIVILYFVFPVASLVVGLSLMSFALLESVFDFCVGCVVYTYIVLPVFGTS